MVKLELNLPWKPILAWPWGVTYKIDPTTFLITDHQESWDIAPIEVRYVLHGIAAFFFCIFLTNFNSIFHAYMHISMY